MKRDGEPSRPLVEQTIDDLSAILRLRTYLAPPAWGELNLTIGQLQVLMKLRRFGRVPMHRIAAWAASGPAAATSVGRLERHGLVERVHRPTDRRIVEARLTAEGTNLIDEVLASGARGSGRSLTPSTTLSWLSFIGFWAGSSPPARRSQDGNGVATIQTTGMTVASTPMISGRDRAPPDEPRPRSRSPPRRNDDWPLAVGHGGQTRDRSTVQRRPPPAFLGNELHATSGDAGSR